MTGRNCVSELVPPYRTFFILGFACFVLLALSEPAKAQFSFPPSGGLVTFQCGNYPSGDACTLLDSTSDPGCTQTGDYDNFLQCGGSVNASCHELIGYADYQNGSGNHHIAMTVSGGYGAGCTQAPSHVTPNIGPPAPNNRQTTASEPISTGNGNYYYQHVDFSLPGHLPLVFKRTYNALSTFSGPLGANWTYSYYIRLGQNSTGAVVQWGDGHGENFTLNGSTYVPEPGITDTLTMDSSTGWFYLTNKSRTQYRFDHDGNLWTITDRNGNYLQMQYDANNNLTLIQEGPAALNLAYDSAGHLISVDDNNGRTVHFSYGNQTASTGTINVTTNSTTVTGTGTPFNSGMVGGLLTVGPTLMGRVVSVQSATSLTTDAMWLGSNVSASSYTLTYGTDLTSVTDAAGGVTKYAYDSQHRLTSIMLSNGAFLVRI